MKDQSLIDNFKSLDLNDAPLHIQAGYEWVQLQISKLESARFFIFWCQKRLTKQALWALDDYAIEEFFQLNREAFDISIEKLTEGILIIINLYYFESKGLIDWSIFAE